MTSVGSPGVVVDGAKMRRLRHGRGLTLAKLATLAGVSYPTVQHMESTRSDRGCSPTTLDLVAEALCVEPEVLLPADPSSLSEMVAELRACASTMHRWAPDLAALDVRDRLLTLARRCEGSAVELTGAPS